MKKALITIALLASLNAGAVTIADSTDPQRHELPKASDLGNKHFWQDKGPECNDAVARERRRVISNCIGLIFLAGLVAVVITAIAQSQKAAAGK